MAQLGSLHRMFKAEINVLAGLDFLLGIWRESIFKFIQFLVIAERGPCYLTGSHAGVILGL